jgi:hypothetical protein
MTIDPENLRELTQSPAESPTIPKAPSPNAHFHGIGDS